MAVSLEGHAPGRPRRALAALPRTRQRAGRGDLRGRQHSGPQRVADRPFRHAHLLRRLADGRPLAQEARDARPFLGGEAMRAALAILTFAKMASTAQK